MYGAQYVNQLRSIAVCGLVHKYVRKATPEFTVEKLYNSQAGTVLPMERLDFYHCRQKYSGAVRGLPLCLGICFGSGTGVALKPAGWDHWANGVVLGSSVSWAFEFLLVCCLQRSLFYQRFTTLRLHNSPITKGAAMRLGIAAP